jgi:hypothetical protein
MILHKGTCYHFAASITIVVFKTTGAQKSCPNPFQGWFHLKFYEEFFKQLAVAYRLGTERGV